MDTYRVISDASGVPELAGLRATYVDEPGPMEGGEIEFDTNYALDARLSQIEQAVGQRCEVIRSLDGREISKGRRRPVGHPHPARLARWRALGVAARADPALADCLAFFDADDQ